MNELPAILHRPATLFTIHALRFVHARSDYLAALAAALALAFAMLALAGVFGE